jgi:hypothetical protein
MIPGTRRSQASGETASPSQEVGGKMGRGPGASRPGLRQGRPSEATALEDALSRVTAASP